MGVGPGQSHSSQLPVLGASVQAPSVRRGQHAMGTWDSDVKQLTGMKRHDGSDADTHPVVPGWTLGLLSNPLLPVFYSQELGQTASPSAEECDLKTCLSSHSALSFLPTAVIFRRGMAREDSQCSRFLPTSSSSGTW